VKKFRYILALAAITCFVCGLFSSVFVQAQVGTTVSISAPTQVAIGTDFIALVNVDSVTGFNAANLDVTFNAAILQVGNVTSGLISGTTIPVDMWSVIAPGKLRVILNVPGTTAVSGSGYLSQIMFHVIGPAGNTSQINLASGVLSDNSANQILANWVGDTVGVYAQTPTPKPSATATPTPAATPSITATPTSTPTLTPTPKPTTSPATTPTPTPMPTITPTPTDGVTSPGGGGGGGGDGGGGQMPSPTPGPTPTPPATPTTTIAEVTATPTCGPLCAVTPTSQQVNLSVSTSTPIDLSGVVDEYGVTQSQLAMTFTDIGAEIDVRQGATVLTVDGAPLRVINVGVVSMPPAPPVDSYIIGLGYDFVPAGATVNPAMTLILQYDPALCPKGVAQEDLFIAYYDVRAGMWVRLECTVNTISHTVAAEVGQFSLFAIVGKAAPAPGASRVNESLLGGVIAGVIVMGAVAYFFVRRRSTQSS